MGEKITDGERIARMSELGFDFDEGTGLFSLGDSAYLGGVDSNINAIGELIARDVDRHPMDPQSYAAEMKYNGAELFLGRGGIDDYGQHVAKGLYCGNFKEWHHQRKH